MVASLPGTDSHNAHWLLMKKLIITLILLVLALAVMTSPVAAQQKRGALPRKPAPVPAAEPIPTFDTLLADDSYKVYSEVRGLGQLIRSPALNDLLDSVMKIGGPPKEFKTVMKWLEAHADSIAGSRMFVASWPTNTKLPAVVMAIEFASPEEAQKFEPELRRFMPMLAPTPAPTPAVASADQSQTNSGARPQTSENASLPYHITHAGSLVLLSDKPFVFRDLKPRRAKLLAEDPNFVTARNRFAAESIFLYVDVKAIEKEDAERRKRMEEEQRRAEEEAAKRPKIDEKTEIQEPITDEFAVTTVEKLPPPSPPAANTTATLGTTEPPASSGTLSAQETTASQDSQFMNALTGSFYAALFGGQSKWPDAIAAAVAFEADAYVVRALILSGAENKPLAVPFFPQLISGPVVTPQSPAVFPADAVLFVSASLDYPQIHDELFKTFARMNEVSRNGQTVNANATVSPFAEYEKKLGVKIKADILPLLGNEFAFALVPKPASESSANTLIATSDNNQPKKATFDPDPVIAIAVRDKDAVRSLIPRMIESLGFKGANLLAQTERKDDTEIISYAGMMSYAFVGDFLIFSPNTETTKRAVASYLTGETLAGSSHFRNANRWQSQQTLAQVYMAPAMAQTFGSLNLTSPANEKMAELLARLSPIEPLTYSLSNEGSGPLHELHVPKNLLMLMVAGIANDASAAPLNANEAAAKSELRTLLSAEITYQATTGDGSFGTLDELIKAGLMSKAPIERYGYEMELTVSGNKFEITAVPIEYGKSGRLSYFIDESGMLRGGDHGGGQATISDPPIQ